MVESFVLFIPGNFTFFFSLFLSPASWPTFYSMNFHLPQLTASYKNFHRTKTYKSLRFSINMYETTQQKPNWWSLVYEKEKNLINYQQINRSFFCRWSCLWSSFIMEIIKACVCVLIKKFKMPTCPKSCGFKCQNNMIN